MTQNLSMSSLPLPYEWSISPRGGFLSFKGMPSWIGAGHNTINPHLMTSEEFLEIRVVFRSKQFFYHEIQEVDFTSGFWRGHCLTFTPKEGFYRYSIHLSDESDAAKILPFLEMKGIRLSRRAREFLLTS